MILDHIYLVILGCISLALLFMRRQLSFQDKVSKSCGPPFVNIAREDLLFAPVESMTAALRDHGPIIAIRRHGNIEYLASKEYTHEILTDESSFSFEQGISKLLGLDWIFNLHGGTFFHDMDSLVKEYLARRLDKIVLTIWPVFERGVNNMVSNGLAMTPVNILPHVQATMGEATIKIFLGRRYNNPQYVKSIVDIAEDIAELLGLFKNRSSLARNLPWLWRYYTWIRIVIFRIPRHIGLRFAWDLWTDISHSREANSIQEETIVSYLRTKYVSPDDHLPFASKLWMLVLILTVVFASLHQTVTTIVWVTYFLALRSDCQDRIRNELVTICNGDGADNNGDREITFKTIQQAVELDSFIREVLRMKGDTVSLVRLTTRDAPLGGYIIPKGSLCPQRSFVEYSLIQEPPGSLVLPVTYLSSRSTDFLPEPDEFKACRWVGTGHSAATTGPGYLAFGLGRWSCPGRILATTEIKIWLLALIECAQFELEGGQYQVIDPHNTASVPPCGRLLFESH